jgi:hypothetical protein
VNDRPGEPGAAAAGDLHVAGGDGLGVTSVEVTVASRTTAVESSARPSWLPLLSLRSTSCTGWVLSVADLAGAPELSDGYTPRALFGCGPALTDVISVPA